MTLKICKTCNKDKDLSEFYKDKKLSDGHTSDCKFCVKIKVADYKARNREKVLEKKRQYNSENRNKQSVWHKEWREKNREYFNEICRKWSENNPDRRAEISSKSAKKYPEKRAKNAAARRARVANAMPKWLTQDQLLQIEAVYSKARQLTIETGIQHEVDHIIPIAGKTACGLHVPWNLQILKISENRKKHNKIVELSQ